jgi:hypothetical protein
MNDTKSPSCVMRAPPNEVALGQGGKRRQNMTEHRMLVCLGIVLLAGPGACAAGEKGEGSDLEFGGAGGGQGKFSHLAETFDADNHLYVLDGGSVKKGAKTGNFLVQRFDGSGHFLGEVSVHDDTTVPAEQNAPARLTVDRQGRIYVSQPLAGQVWQVNAQGQRLATVKIPGAFAMTTRQAGGREEILVAANQPKSAPAQVLERNAAADSAGARNRLGTTSRGQQAVGLRCARGQPALRVARL